MAVVVMAAAAVALGPDSSAVQAAIRAAEQHDRAAFAAQFVARPSGGLPKMATLDLRPDCILNRVMQSSAILVVASWTCQAGKTPATAQRGFLVNRGKIAAVTGEPVHEYHLSVN